MLAQEEHHLCTSKDAQIAGDAETVRVFTQQLIAPRVEGLDWRGGVPVRHETVDASLHLLRGAVGEGQREDLLRERALLGDQPGDTPCNHLRLPCASASNYQKWTFAVGDRRILLVVQIVEEMRKAVTEGAWRADRNSRPDWDLVDARWLFVLRCSATRRAWRHRVRRVPPGWAIAASIAARSSSPSVVSLVPFITRFT